MGCGRPDMFDPTLEEQERTLLEMMWPRGAMVRTLMTAGRATAEDLRGLKDRELATIADGFARLTDRGCFAIGHLWGPRR